MDAGAGLFIMIGMIWLAEVIEKVGLAYVEAMKARKET